MDVLGRELLTSNICQIGIPAMPVAVVKFFRVFYASVTVGFLPFNFCQVVFAFIVDIVISVEFTGCDTV